MNFIGKSIFYLYKVQLQWSSLPAEPYEEFLCQAELAHRLFQSNGSYVGFALLLLTAELLVFAESAGFALIIIL